MLIQNMHTSEHMCTNKLKQHNWERTEKSHNFAVKLTMCLIRIQPYRCTYKVDVISMYS